MSAKRIYKVSPLPAIIIDKQPQYQRLIRATGSGQALRHATTGLYSVDVATTEDIVRLLSDGVKVENATEAQ